VASAMQLFIEEDEALDAVLLKPSLRRVVLQQNCICDISQLRACLRRGLWRRFGHWIAAGRVPLCKWSAPVRPQWQMTTCNKSAVEQRCSDLERRPCKNQAIGQPLEAHHLMLRGLPRNKTHGTGHICQKGLRPSSLAPKPRVTSEKRLRGAQRSSPGKNFEECPSPLGTWMTLGATPAHISLPYPTRLSCTVILTSPLRART
jgi:hypothetical protein